jgi:hypothetical protein
MLCLMQVALTIRADIIIDLVLRNVIRPMLSGQSLRTISMTIVAFWSSGFFSFLIFSFFVRFFFFFDSSSKLWFCSLTVVHSGALISQQSTAQCERWRISSVWPWSLNLYLSCFLCVGLFFLVYVTVFA